jgi:hypothetical protein
MKKDTENDRVFNIDPDTGAVERFIYDEQTDKVTITHKEDVEPTINYNKAMQNSGNVGWVDKDKSMRKVAEIPPGVMLLWYEQYGICCWKRDHWQGVQRLLNDPEWRYLRTNHVFINSKG